MVTTRDKKYIEALSKNILIAPTLGLCPKPLAAIRDAYQRSAEKNVRHFGLEALLLALCLVLAITCSGLAKERDTARTETARLIAIYSDNPTMELYNEAEMIVQACIAQIGTETEEICFGYSFTTLLQYITAEGGSDYDTCFAVATCCFNACRLTGGRFDPVEICRLQQYDTPASHYTKEAMQACVNVFLRARFCEEVQDATAFHCLGRGNTRYHDSIRCEWVYAHNGVDYYRELKDWGELGK